MLLAGGSAEGDMLHSGSITFCADHLLVWGGWNYGSAFKQRPLSIVYYIYEIIT